MIQIASTNFNDHEAEWIFICRIFYDHKHSSRIVYELFPEIFTNEVYRKIYEEYRNCLNEGVSTHYTQVYLRLRNKNEIVAAEKALEASTHKATMSSDVESVATFLIYTWYKRMFSHITLTAFNENNQLDSDPRDIRKKMMELFDQMDNRLPSLGHNAKTMALKILKDSEAGPESVEEKYPIFDLVEMDSRIDVETTDYVLIAARPSMGKTSLLLKIAHSISKNKRFKLYSLETKSVLMVRRLISSLSGIPFKMLDDMSKLTHEQIKAYQTAVDQISTYLEIEDKMFGIEEIVMDLYSWSAGGNCGGWGLDHIGLAETKKKTNTKEEKLSEISRQVKKACMKTDIPGFILSQLSREVEKRSSKKPELSDIRDSGALEQDADIVILPWRPDYYGIIQDEEGNDLSGLCKMIIAKYKNGGKQSILTTFNEKTMAFGPYNKQESIF